MPGLRVQFPVQLFVTVPLQGALEMQTNKASELDLWFDFFFLKRQHCAVTLIALQLVAR